MIVELILPLFIGQLCQAAIHRGGILYPRGSETRQVTYLDGVWNFLISNGNQSIGFEQQWYKRDLRDIPEGQTIPMPVPSSYNDITTDPLIRDHVGWAWYDRTFFVPKYWSDVGRVWLRFDSVHYATQVWVNGELVMSHEIGHLPFLAETTDYLKYGKENRITVAVNNTLNSTTIPAGEVYHLSSGRLKQGSSIDFFNFAGIHRHVRLYTTPKTYIDDITVTTIEASSDIGRLHYNVTIEGESNVSCRVKLSDKSRVVVAKSLEAAECIGTLNVSNPNLWWPYLMHPEPGYLYSFEVELLNTNGSLVDKYVQPVGIRQLQWTNTSFLLNGLPLYLKGFGRHEDSDIRGKGLDLPLISRDYSLIKWIGANAYRTSHYPYAEEIMDMADQMGIMIVDECPAAALKGFGSEEVLANHKQSLTELIKRDKNRPAVVIWSAANEPSSTYPEAPEYFRKIIEHIKSLDTSRATTIVEFLNVAAIEGSKYVDILSFNYYDGWYANESRFDVIKEKVVSLANDWHNKFGKPVLISEYGGDTLEGFHSLPNYIWSEEYQVELVSKHFEAFDALRDQGFFIGEFIWNFADFKTTQKYKRAGGGNKKGIFTRNRQPKAAAHLMRRRYWGLAKELYNVELPDDIDPYVVKPSEGSYKQP